MGARGMAFPRLSALSFWVFAVGGVLVLSSGRPGVDLRFSTDGGRTWTEPRKLVPVPKRFGQSFYRRLFELDPDLGPGISRETFDSIIREIRALYEDEAQPKLIRQVKPGASNGEVTDIICPMYPSPQSVINYSAQPREKPFIMCEYAYGKGNTRERHNV